MGWWSVSMSLPQDAGWRLAGRSGPAGGMLLAEGWVGFGTVCVEMCINILYIFVYKRRKRKKKKSSCSLSLCGGGGGRLHAPPCILLCLSCCQQRRGGEQASYSELPPVKQGKDGLGTEQEGNKGVPS